MSRTVLSLPALIALLLLASPTAEPGGTRVEAATPSPAPGTQEPDQEPDDEPAPAPDGPEQDAGDASNEATPDGTESEDDDDAGLDAYEDVITEEAVTDRGVFVTHRVDDAVYYEIPVAELDQEFLWVGQIARTTEGIGFGGQALGSHVVRWSRQGDRILLRSVSYRVVADPGRPIAQAVDAANNDTIIKAFDIETYGPDEAPVIDVTALFETEVPEFSARTRLGARGFARDRSFVETVRAFPTNIEVTTTHTYTSPPPAPGASRTTPRRGMAPGSATVLLHFSMVRLPDDPMTPRLFDERVGYFSVRQRDFGRDEHRAVERRYITRWRLEKQDPSAERSDPVTPITFWIDPATPAQWVPYLRAGIESWQPAFEAAGFTNAIVGREAPSPDEDPDWSAEDARHSVIRWLPSPVANAYGPHIHDPRTGEILEADIQFHHNVMSLVRDWYFVQVAPLDPRARTLPLPDDLMGELLQFVAAHEVGHSLGFQHNMKASSLYPLDRLRDPRWVEAMSHTPTLMDYSRFNYVAQPEDGIPPRDLIPKIGPYDLWATRWGYAPIPGAATPDEEQPTLDRWAREQDDTPWLRFSTDGGAGVDPGQLTEAVGDADAVAATTLGLANLERVAALLLDATSREGEPYDDLEQVYGRLLGQWATEMAHVAQIIGGLDSQQKHGGQDGVRFTPLPRERQEAAVAFLNTHAFETPSFLIDPEILRRIEASGVVSRIGAAQRRVLVTALGSARIVRLVEQEALDDTGAYPATSFLEDLRHGVWRELGATRVDVDPYRRELHRSYLAILDGKLNGARPVTSDERAFVRGELRALAADLDSALDRSADRTTRLHLEDAVDQIARSLDPPVTGSAGTGNGRALTDDATLTGMDPGSETAWPWAPYRCWVDHAVMAAADHAVGAAVEPSW